MSKDGFVTNNLHRISDRIAEVAKKHVILHPLRSVKRAL